MKERSTRGVWAALAAGVLAVAGTVALAGGASAQLDRGSPPDATIEAKIGNGKIKFAGPKTVARFSLLRVWNNTDSEAIGPHTFTLVTKGQRPNSQREFRKCARLQLRICKRVARAHQVNLETFEVGRPTVDVGRDGWDRMFNRKKRGDSWFTGIQDEEQVRQVTAPVGKTLTYFCVIHPEMRGKFKVTAPVPEA